MAVVKKGLGWCFFFANINTKSFKYILSVSSCKSICLGLYHPSKLGDLNDPLFSSILIPNPRWRSRSPSQNYERFIRSTKRRRPLCWRMGLYTRGVGVAEEWACWRMGQKFITFPILSAKYFFHSQNRVSFDLYVHKDFTTCVMIKINTYFT